jgi:hypothetical protein
VQTTTLYTQNFIEHLVADNRVARLTSGYEPARILFPQSATKCSTQNLVGYEGIEPSNSAPQTQRLATSLITDETLMMVGFAPTNCGKTACSAIRFIIETWYCIGESNPLLESEVLPT